MEWSRRELAKYLAAAADPAVAELPTRCAPWTVQDLTAHLAATFRRFADLLDASRSGDFSAPFAREELAAENLRTVREFDGDALAELDLQATRFLDAVAAPNELIAHQFGPIPVGLQVMFGLNELAVHQDDLAQAAGGSYRPEGEVVVALATMYGRVFGLPDGDDLWTRLLTATGR